MADLGTGLHLVSSAASASRLSRALLRGARVLSAGLGGRLPPVDEPLVDDAGWSPLASPAAARLRRAWFRRSTETSWRCPGDWWHPACDAVVDALVAGGDLRRTVRLLGRARAALGVAVEETLDDVLALWHALDGSEPSPGVLRAAAGGWAEAALEPASAASCVDALTGLTTRSHLEARVAELYRSGVLGGQDSALALVVLDFGPVTAVLGVPATDQPWRDVEGLYRCAEALRRVFSQGEVLTRLAPRRLGALAATGPDLARRLGDLDGLLATAAGPDLASSVWVEPLPRTVGLVPHLLTDLAR